MEMVDEDPDEEAARARYQVDICRLADSNEAITHSFEALVVLLVDRLPVSRMGNPGGAGSEREGEEESENAEDEHVE